MLMLADHRHAQAYYRKDGKPTSEVRNIGLAIRTARQIHGHTLALGFGPLALKAVRDSLIGSGICRNEVKTSESAISSGSSSGASGRR